MTDGVFESDPGDDEIRAREGIQIKDYNPGAESKPGEQTWTTQRLKEDFEVLGFAMGLAVVRRKSDGVMGSLEFTHNPRLYYGWKEEPR